MQQQEELYSTIRISEIKKEVTGFKTIVFEDGHNISYKAGQYLTLVKTIAGNEVRRSYSITACPVLHEPLSIGVKRVENGLFSRKLVDDAKVGDELITTGSGGFFVLPDDALAVKRLLFFAAGSGITPVLSLVKTALHQFAHLEVVLVYSNASVERAAYLSQLQQLEIFFPGRFYLENLFSNAINLSRARLHRDLLLALLQQYTGGIFDTTCFYVCGPESYMRLCTYTLQETGVAPAQIRRENFYFHEVARRDTAPPDKNDYTAVFHFPTHQHSVMVRYPDSILAAAKKAGLHLPYSCEAGRCGSCVARCTLGRVWHSYNEVLTEKEIAKGLVLTCTGHPVGGNVALHF